MYGGDVVMLFLLQCMTVDVIILFLLQRMTVENIMSFLLQCMPEQHIRHGAANSILAEQV